MQLVVVAADSPGGRKLCQMDWSFLPVPGLNIGLEAILDLPGQVPVEGLHSLHLAQPDCLAQCFPGMEVSSRAYQQQTPKAVDRQPGWKEPVVVWRVAGQKLVQSVAPVVGSMGFEQLALAAVAVAAGRTGKVPPDIRTVQEQGLLLEPPPVLARLAFLAVMSQ